MAERTLRVCLIATEYPGFGPYGGFGVLTRDIALGLVVRGLEIFVVMPRKERQKPIEVVEGVTVASYPSPTYVGVGKALPYAGLYRAIDADVYHSQEPSIGTAIAQAGAPEKVHLVTFQDPRDFLGWRVERAAESLTTFQELRFWWRYKWQIGGASRRADAQFSQAKFIIPMTQKLYGLRQPPAFLPNPLRMSEISTSKAAQPTVCYLGRWDPRKRPELFLNLAERFPQVRFIFIGACLNDLSRDAAIRARAAAMPNVTLPGWVNAQQRGTILDGAWILINTSTRECLPVSYLEAGARGCAILSHCDADDFASNFGYWARRGDLEDYVEGLSFLLGNDRWKSFGEKAHEYVKSTHEYEKVIDQHVSVYRREIARKSEHLAS